MEIWKVVASNPNYEVSSEGRVRRITAAQGTRAGYVLKQRLDPRGYYIVGLVRYGVKHDEKSYAGPVFVHRLMAYAFLPTDHPAYGLDVNHKNSNRADNSLGNLEWCTHQQNMAHSRDAGRSGVFDRKGGSNGNSKLTEDDVRAIRAMRAAGARRIDVAAKFGITETQVYTIVTRKQWGHVI